MHRSSALLFTLALAMVGLSCGADAGGGDEGPSATRSNAALRDALSRCSLATEGDVRAFDKASDPNRDRCRADCVEKASCKVLERWACREEGPIEACLDACGSEPQPKFECAEGSVVGAGSVCDGEKDCKGGEDERNCAAFFEKVATKCADGHYVSRHQTCDGSWDCRDGADEANCPDAPFECADGRDILPAHEVCDLVPDCSDSSDEKGCARMLCPDLPKKVSGFEGTFVCPGTWLLFCYEDPPCECPIFHCASGESISQALVCDFVKDCPDASDEADCKLYGKPPFPCKKDQKSLAEKYVCDGTKDCSDGSDETSLACQYVQR